MRKGWTIYSMASHWKTEQNYNIPVTTKYIHINYEKRGLSSFEEIRCLLRLTGGSTWEVDPEKFPRNSQESPRTTPSLQSRSRDVRHCLSLQNHAQRDEVSQHNSRVQTQVCHYLEVKHLFILFNSEIKKKLYSWKKLR